MGYLVTARAETINLAHLGKTLLPYSTFLPPLHCFFPKPCKLTSRDQVLAFEACSSIAHSTTAFIHPFTHAASEFPAHPHHIRLTSFCTSAPPNTTTSSRHQVGQRCICWCIICLCSPLASLPSITVSHHCHHYCISRPPILPFVVSRLNHLHRDNVSGCCIATIGASFTKLPSNLPLH